MHPSSPKVLSSSSRRHTRVDWDWSSDVCSSDLASCTLSGGSCTVVITGVASGSFTVMGNYGGDSTHNGSSGTSAAINVTPGQLDNTSTTVVCAPASINIGGTSTCTATVTDTTTPANTPSGSVSFTSSNTAVGTVGASCTLVSGSCPVTFTGVAPGTATVTGTYGGDSSHNGSSGTSGTISVVKDDTSTSVSCAASVTVGLTGSCTVTVSDTTTPANTPSGSVSLTSSDTTVGTVDASCTLSGGSCTVVITGVASGSFTVMGNYGGDSTHNGSSGTSAAINVTPGQLDNTSTTVVCAPASINIGETSACTVTVTDIGSNPTSATGTVTFTLDAGTTGGSLSSGTCNLTTPVVPGQPPSSCFVTFLGSSAAGIATVSASYDGDATHNTSSSIAATITVTSVIPPLTVDFSFSPSSPTVGQSVSFSSSVSGGTTPYTYAWDFGDGSTSAAVNPSHTYSTAGSFTVELAVTDSSSPMLSQSAPHTVIVSPVTGQKDFTISARPTSITLVGESPLCEGASTLCDDEASTTITLTSINGFDGTVRLARSVSPRNGLLTVYCRQGATQLMPGATVKIRCFVEPEINPDSQTTFTVTIIGRFGALGSTGFLSHSVTITVTVAHAPTPSDDNTGDPPSSPLTASTGTSSTGATIAVGGLVVASGTLAESRGQAHGHGHAYGHGGHHHNDSA